MAIGRRRGDPLNGRDLKSMEPVDADQRPILRWRMPL